VLTLDFFPPIVDDPFDFGRVAAVNSLSDVYAMGGRPLAAMNVAGFPEKKLPAEVLAEILQGGAESAARAGCALVGGHTVDDDELKYGLAVVGTIHPDRIVTNAGARPGDALILTKPLGTGLVSTALMKDELDDDGVRRLIDVMTTPNDTASARMLEHDVTACTDITGFGLAGHCYEMARASGVTVRLQSASLPVIEGALWAAEKGYLTGGGSNNRSFVNREAAVADGLDENLLHIVFDPQTSGGLLIAVPMDNAEALLASLGDACPQASVVGECLRPRNLLLKSVEAS